ncbi:MAG: tRNA uridine-5-carboxymethylaminomethyl(34) synthesis GTPase MnmE [Clostridia bacterium]|nr:tRNA uridine-5-carboxymethylaminomethyl(34) synthesis GTPase MnmE [Clostridia bacterium]
MFNTIAAISTPPGKGGVAIIRISGADVCEITERVFRPASGRRLSDYPARTQVYGYIIYNNERIDDGLATVFPAPHSYTGEDVCEISCHGGSLVSATVLEAVFAAGAVPAESGEFTRRAFINGRLSLTDAEAIGSLLDAKSREEMRLGAEPARTRLRTKIGEIRTAITTLLGSIYARIDYPDEDLGDFTEEQTLAELVKIRELLNRLIDSYKTGRAITEGISAVICGKPNVGKSTIYNLILDEEAAIVTSIPGTTRDLLEKTVPLGRVLLRLTDTAGIRSEGADTVEKIGIERSREKIAAAELIIAVFDLSRELDREDEDLLLLLKEARGAKICILNKADGAEKLDTGRLNCDFDATIRTSARDGGDEALRHLTEVVDRLFTDEKISTSTDAVVSSARQHSSLLRAREFIDAAITAYSVGMPADAASSDIELALGAIGELDGRSVSESVVGDIFSRFCVGK